MPCKGVGLHNNIGKDRARRCSERHTNREGPGGRVIWRAWDEAEVAHEFCAHMVNAAAPLAKPSGAAAETVRVFHV
eukprot:3404931-Alexandrium_andersonii.AAC.1